jgi:hypothetical protein
MTYRLARRERSYLLLRRGNAIQWVFHRVEEVIAGEKENKMKALMVREELERFLVVKMRTYSPSITAVTVFPLHIDGLAWDWDVSEITEPPNPNELVAIERKIIRPLQEQITLAKGGI